MLKAPDCCRVANRLAKTCSEMPMFTMESSDTVCWGGREKVGPVVGTSIVFPIS